MSDDYETERHPHDEFMKADAIFSAACRAYHDAADQLWQATKMRSEAWNKLRDSVGEHNRTTRRGDCGRRDL